MNLVNKDVEAKLLELTTNIKGESGDYYGMHFAFSRLLDHYRSEYQLKIAINILSDIFKEVEGSIFLCKDKDIAIVYKGEDRMLLEKAIFQLRYLFVDDPLAYDNEGDENPEFCVVYDLGFQWRNFYQLCKEKVGIKIKKENEPEVQSVRSSPVSAQSRTAILDGGASKTILTPAKLSLIENDLTNADLRLALRRQSVCANIKGADLRPVFEEVYINIPHLKKLLGMDIDLTSNQWLFKYLTQILDGYVLDTLAKRQNEFLASPVSLNMNVETILADKFLKFNSRIDNNLKSSIILEIHVADVFVDMVGFLAAKDMAHELGYRVCIDGLSALSFIQIDRESLGFDLAKLQWNADMRSDLITEQNRRLQEAVQRCGSNRMILCRCDTKNAIDYGQALGISLFQGRYTDSILDPNAKIIN